MTISYQLIKEGKKRIEFLELPRAVFITYFDPITVWTLHHRKKENIFKKFKDFIAILNVKDQLTVNSYGVVTNHSLKNS